MRPLGRGAGQPVDPFLMGVEHGIGLGPGQLLSGLPDLSLLCEDSHPAAGKILQQPRVVNIKPCFR